MKLKVFENKKLIEDRIEIYCQQKTPIVEAVIQFIEDYDFNTMNITGIYNEERRLEKKVFEVKYTLSKIEDRLKQYGFIRINKSNVVNIYKIEKGYRG